jgi:transcription elongation GreA/GreB family factor
MAKKPGSRAEFLFFNVVYDDGSQRSNRRVPAELLGGLDKDEPARGTLSHVAPLARALFGKSVGDVVGIGAQDAEITTIA